MKEKINYESKLLRFESRILQCLARLSESNKQGSYLELKRRGF